jgi:CubicO group peptidase (beta-lactamase class C family)
MKKLLNVLILTLLTGKFYGQVETVDSFIVPYVREHNFNGTILIQQNTHTIYHKSFGFANLQFKVPNATDTKYKVASITKAFTAVLILQLYEQRKIDLNKPVKSYLPYYSGEGADKVSIHQLLNMTSGMVNIDRIPSLDHVLKNGLPLYQTPYTSDQILNKYCSDTLVNKPGTVFDYNNANYIILGKIIEQIYGKTFERALIENILNPLEMKSSGMLYQHSIIDNLADTYFYREDLKTLVNDLPVYIENWYSDGGMYSTTSDILKFSNALFGLKLLKKETLDIMMKPGLDNYGYSLWINNYKINDKQLTAIKRPGLIMGAQSMLLHFIKPDFTIIILSNTGTTDLDEFVLEISKRIIE